MLHPVMKKRSAYSRYLNRCAIFSVLIEFSLIVRLRHPINTCAFVHWWLNMWAIIGCVLFFCWGLVSSKQKSTWSHPLILQFFLVIHLTKLHVDACNLLTVKAYICSKERFWLSKFHACNETVSFWVTLRQHVNSVCANLWISTLCHWLLYISLQTDSW